MPPPPKSPTMFSGGDGGVSSRPTLCEVPDQADVVDVVPAVLGERSLLPPAGHPRVHQPRVHGVAVPGAEAEAAPSVPGRNPSMLTSAHLISSSARSRPASDFRSTTSVRLPRSKIDRPSCIRLTYVGTPEADHFRAVVGQHHSGERPGAQAADLYDLTPVSTGTR